MDFEDTKEEINSQRGILLGVLLALSLFASLLLISTNTERFQANKRPLGPESIAFGFSASEVGLPPDAIDPPCPINADPRAETRDFEIAFRLSDIPGWIRNLTDIDSSEGETIDPNKKQPHRGEVSVGRGTEICRFAATFRISGDFKDHVDMHSLSASLDVRLHEGHLGGFTRFKAFIPETRGGEAEVIATSFLRQIGFLAPRTFISEVDFNGRPRTFLIQENAEKEMLESSSSREGPILELDELTGWSLPFQDVDTGLITSPTTLFFGRMTNSSWSQLNPVARDISWRSADLLARSVMSTYRASTFPVLWEYGGVDLPWYANLRDETMANGSDWALRELRRFRLVNVLLGAEHHFHGGNRRFLFDPTLNGLRPIYYDGNVDLGWEAAPHELLEGVSGDDLLWFQSELDAFDDGTFRAQVLDHASTITDEHLDSFLASIQENLLTIQLAFAGSKSLSDRGPQKLPSAASLSWGHIGDTSRDEGGRLQPGDSPEAGLLSSVFPISQQALEFGIPIMSDGPSEAWIRFAWLDDQGNFLGFDTPSLGRTAVGQSETWLERSALPPINAASARIGIFVDPSNSRLYSILDPKARLEYVEFPLAGQAPPMALATNHVLQDLVFGSPGDWHSCDTELTLCAPLSINNEQERLLLSGRLQIDGRNLKYLGFDVALYRNGVEAAAIHDSSSRANVIPFLESTTLLSIGDPEVRADLRDKRLTINLEGSEDRILIAGGRLSGWEIEIQGTRAEPSFEPDGRFNDLGLTGCLNIFDVELDNVTIKSTGGVCEDAVNIVRGRGNLSLLVKDSFQDAIDLDFGDLTIRYLEVTEAGNDCLDVSAGKFNFLDVRLERCGDKGASVGEAAITEFKSLSVDHGLIGLAVKDSAMVSLDQIRVSNAEICMTAYRKKQEFGGGLIEFESAICGDSENVVQEGSYLAEVIRE